MTTELWILSAFLWLLLGWVGVWRLRREILNDHLVWEMVCEVQGVLLVLLGPLALLGTFLPGWPKGCNKAGHEFCKQQVYLYSMRHSLFGRWMPFTEEEMQLGRKERP